MQDMIPPRGERSIRNIPVPANHRRPPQGPPPQEQEEEPMDNTPLPPRMPPRRRSFRLWWWLGGVIIVCAVGAILLSTVFEGATVTVYAKSQQVTPPGSITASPNAPSGSLAYQVMTVTQSATTTAPASGMQQVSTSATGLITVYNAYSTDKQALITNTRFQAPDGKIYRIHTPITVPGEIKNADGTYTPGSVTATVYADQPGADYNRSTPTTFTIPGFQGDPRYDKFSAQSQGAISGGFVGQQPVVSQSDMATAQASLKQSLDAAVRSAAGSNVPNGYILVAGSTSESYSGIAQTQGSGPAGADNTAILSQSVTAQALIVKEGDLASLIAKAAVQGYNGEAVGFKDPSGIIVSVASSTGKAITGPVSLSLSGTPTLLWQFDVNALKQALIGKPKSQFESIIQTFEPAVEKADATIRPFWESNFPSDPGKITLMSATQ